MPRPISRRLAITLTILALSAGEAIVGTLFPPLLRDRGYDPATIGMLVATLPAVSLFMRIPGGVLYTPARARVLMIGALAVCAAVSLVYPMAGAFWTFFLARAMHGMGLSMATTVNMAMFVETLPEGPHRGRAVGMYSGGLAFGYSVGNIAGGFTADLWGYQGAFVFLGLVWLAALVPMLLMEPVAATPHRAREDADAPRPKLRDVLLEPGVAGVVLCGFYLNGFLTMFNTFFPLLLLSTGVTLGQLGILRSAYSLTNAVGRPLTGLMMSRLNHRTVQKLGLVVHGLSMVLFALPMGFLMYLVVTIMAASGRAVAHVANTMALAEDIDPKQIPRGLGSGILNASRDLGNITSPIVGGLVAQVVGIETFWLIMPPLWLGSYLLLLSLTQWRARAIARSLQAGV